MALEIMVILLVAAVLAAFRVVDPRTTLVPNLQMFIHVDWQAVVATDIVDAPNRTDSADLKGFPSASLGIANRVLGMLRIRDVVSPPDGAVLFSAAVGEWVLCDSPLSRYEAHQSSHTRDLTNIADRFLSAERAFRDHDFGGVRRFAFEEAASLRAAASVELESGSGRGRTLLLRIAKDAGLPGWARARSYFDLGTIALNGRNLARARQMYAEVRTFEPEVKGWRISTESEHLEEALAR